MPTFHKYAGEICDGFQIHLTGGDYHSLAHSLKLIRYIRDNSANDFGWRDEVYEFREDRLAIELLAGDPLLIDYLNGRCEFNLVKEAFIEEEDKWIKQAKSYLLYPEPLFRLNII